MGSIYTVGAYLKKPHSLALKSHGIRIVALANDPQEEENLRNAAYKGLFLLEEYDHQMFNQVREHIRIIFLVSTNLNAHHVPLGRFYSLNLYRVPQEFPKGKLPIIVAGSLVWQATLAKCNGGIVYFDKLKGAAVRELCRSEQRRTMQKLGVNTDINKGT